jgi:histidine triad (HIT) family protein
LPEYDPENIFARILRGEIPCHKIYEDESNLGLMDIMPRGMGHCLVIPKVPVRNILDAPDSVLSTLYTTVAKVGRAAKSAYDADGLTIQQFNETAGGQMIFHMHVHIIPRFEGVALRPHSGEMEKPEILAQGAERIRAFLT